MKMQTKWMLSHSIHTLLFIIAVTIILLMRQIPGANFISDRASPRTIIPVLVLALSLSTGFFLTFLKEIRFFEVFVNELVEILGKEKDLSKWRAFPPAVNQREDSSRMKVSLNRYVGHLQRFASNTDDLISGQSISSRNWIMKGKG